MLFKDDMNFGDYERKEESGPDISILSFDLRRIRCDIEFVLIRRQKNKTFFGLVPIANFYCEMGKQHKDKSNTYIIDASYVRSIITGIGRQARSQYWTHREKKIIIYWDCSMVAHYAKKRRKPFWYYLRPISLNRAEKKEIERLRKEWR